MINLTLDFDAEPLHAQFHEILCAAIERSVQFNCKEVLRSIKEALLSITHYFHQHPEEILLWMDYLDVYKDALSQLRGTSHPKTDSLPAISLLSYHLLCLFEFPRPEWNEEILIRMTNTAMASFVSLFRILSFQHDLQSLPIPEIEEEIMIERSPDSPSETDELAAVSTYFVSTVRKIHTEWCNLATNENGSLFIAPPFSNICSVVFINWDQESGLWLIGLYLESAYMFCSGSNSSKETWETQAEGMFREIQNSDNPDNLSETISQWYATRDYEM